MIFISCQEKVKRQRLKTADGSVNIWIFVECFLVGIARF